MSAILLPSRWQRPPNGPVLLDHHHELVRCLDVRAYLLFRRGFYWAEDCSGFGFHASEAGTALSFGDDEEGGGLDGGGSTAIGTLDNTTSATSYCKPAALPVVVASRFSVDNYRTTSTPTYFIACLSG